jgi:hypothetical protein
MATQLSFKLRSSRRVVRIWILGPHERRFVLPRMGRKEGAMSLRTFATVFRVIKRVWEEGGE